MIYIKLKRAFDAVLAFVGMVVLFPLFLIISICIKKSSEGPVFFRQKRIGKDKTSFTLLKFRTMYIETPGDMPTHMLSQPERCITGVGKFLRKTSLDELPQLVNILRGDMSFIGPRPALWNQQDLIAERDRYGANNIKPGLTGWAQVNGRDELDIQTKARFDGEYVNNMSFLFDVKCLFLTVVKVFLREGIVEGWEDSAAKEPDGKEEAFEINKA